MTTWIRIRKIVQRYFADLRWYTIALTTLFYTLSSWGLLYLAGEQALVSQIDFIYWLAVTASTVGYGDLSPATPAGKMVVAFYVIPAGLSIFATVIGRIAAWVGVQWQKGLMGMTSLNVKNHILVIGWNGQRTMLLLNLLLKERDALPNKPDIVLCVSADITNPMPGKIEFVHVKSFNKNEDMDRACVADAATILIDNPQDDVTLTTALYCSNRNPEAHQVAYFTDDSLVPLLQQHCPQVECTPSVAVEMLAKAAFDPGSSMLHHDLISVDEGQAQFSVIIPEGTAPILAERLFINMKRYYNAIFIGYAPGAAYKKMVVNPAMDVKLSPGDSVFYIADKRFGLFDWSQLGE
ncbi:two pore domain potassium channel family protein [Alteromonas aestuariivivens]|uniref:Two pore domain potassium channel family protein n=1 Tax=Alteromonas aestuariivivens TaxID=1938339 RepID=A0A3D8MEQ7_9ALTE|nr:potassium channel family protein [Alteromonas aestuariivivens]RDV29253.1 two pore domain potassium channel family protein [Alteromonas aestuariivivens]